MTNIIKCQGTGCPLKIFCKRYLTFDNNLEQSYFAKPPFKDGSCDMFWGEKQESVFNQLKDIVNGK